MQWITDDGRKLEISQMSDEHIAACIRYLTRRINSAAYWRILFIQEQDRRRPSWILDFLFGE